MKPHTGEQLQGLKNFIDSKVGRDYEQFELLGISVDFRTVNLPEATKPFAFAVAAAVVHDNDGLSYEIAVSDDVPEDLRGLWAWHEYYDFAVLGHQADDRCRQSETVVVTNLDTIELRRYASYRQQFYLGLIGFMENDIANHGDNSAYSGADIQTALDSLHLMQTIA